MEMRFIDMFMTALGSLIFLALLLVFLVRFLPQSSPQGVPAPPPSPAKLRLITKSLPPARVGEAYEADFAYRGGIGAIFWSIPVGEGGLPPGIRFNESEGVLSGIPIKRGTYRFVVAASDSRGQQDTRGFEIDVALVATNAQRFNAWTSGSLLLLLALLAWLIFKNLKFGRYAMKESERAFEQGHKALEFRTPGTHQVWKVELPNGIAELKKRQQLTYRRFLLAAAAFVLILGYFVWSIWPA